MTKDKQMNLICRMAGNIAAGLASRDTYSPEFVTALSVELAVKIFNQVEKKLQ